MFYYSSRQTPQILIITLLKVSLQLKTHSPDTYYNSFTGFTTAQAQNRQKFRGTLQRFVGSDKRSFRSAGTGIC